MSYLIFKALHLIAMVAWFAALFYLPRLFVYYAEGAGNPVVAATLLTMARKLSRYIMLPAMVLTFVFGVLLVHVQWDYVVSQMWFWVKCALVLLLAAYHGYLVRTLKGLQQGQQPRSSRFYRILNEVPTLFLIVIIFLVVLKPF